MSLAWISVGALVTAIVLSCTTAMNVGVLSLALAWIVGVYIGHMPINDILSGFPTSLFITLAGVTLFFAMAQTNGTLERVSQRAVRVCRGNAGLIPLMFFVVALALSTIGPGNISTAALLAPTAMAVAAQAEVPFFLMALMVGNGAQAGALSPFAPTGVIVNGIMGRIGLAGFEWQTYGSNVLAHALLAAGAYVLFGGVRLLSQSRQVGPTAIPEAKPFEWNHQLTLGLMAALVLSVTMLSANIGFAALAAATLLSLTKAADEKESIKRMPWGVVVMVCGVTVLIALMEKTQGMALFTEALARLSTPSTVTAVVAFVTGVVSIYSSTSGVVLPAFLPTVPGLVSRLGGGDPLMIAYSVNVGAHLVDVSPLSTIGALCIAAVPPSPDRDRLFRRLLVWGWSMSLVGAAACQVFFGFRR